MSALSVSTSSPYIAATLARQQVLADQTQVQNDQAQLRQDQVQLDKDLSRSATQLQQSQNISQNQGHQAQQAWLNQQVQPVKPAPTVNTIGQLVGKVINVVA